jgi:glycosyltransferase involved in cell wall biosynthesis
MDLSDIRAVIINYRTPDLTRQALTSLHTQYPYLRILLVDNGSGPESTQLLRDAETGFDSTVSVVRNTRNLHHGPAMHQALSLVTEKYALFLDSDAEVLRNGFIELMHEHLQADCRHYAVGPRLYLDNRGFQVPAGRTGGHNYIHPYCMLVNRALYLTLPPFELHGSPCLTNMIAAAERGLALIPFPTGEYVLHEWRGTAGKFGYRLGWYGWWIRLLNKLGL